MSAYPGTLICPSCGAPWDTPDLVPGPRSRCVRCGAAVLVGKFAVLEQIGRGAAGTVYKAWQTDLERIVALRLFPADSQEFAHHFARAADIAANLTFPGIAAVYEAGQHAGNVYIAMQYVEGTTLDRTDLTLREAAAVIRDAALAVGSAHARNIVHGGLGPHNLVVTPAEMGRRVLVMDFGVDRSVRKEASSRKVLAYRSPEQLEGKPRDARGDVYALGATLYACVAGRPPFAADTPREMLEKVAQGIVDPPSQINPLVDSTLESVIFKAMERDPARRYPAAGPLAADLTRWLEGESPDLRAAKGAAERLRRKTRRFAVAVQKKPRGVLAAAAAALVLGILIAWITAKSGSPSKPPTRSLDPVAKVDPPAPDVSREERVVPKIKEEPVSPAPPVAPPPELPPLVPEPKPKPPPPRAVAFTLQSEPPGARVLVDGRPAGITPLTLHRDEVGDGDAAIEIELQGYVPWKRSVRPSAEPQEIKVLLARPPPREEARPRPSRLGVVQLIHPQYGVFVKLDPGAKVSAGEKLEVVRNAEVVGGLAVERVTPAEREYPQGCAVCRLVKGAAENGDDVRKGGK